MSDTVIKTVTLINEILMACMFNDAATVALYTQRLHIIGAVKARHFSAFVCVH